MTFLEMVTELLARGNDSLGTTRAKLCINRGRARLDSLYRWPFLEDSAVGVAPLSIPTLRQVEAVSNETLEYPLEFAGYADLVSWGCDLSEVGAPQYWYRATPAGAPVIATWPTSTDTIGVQFWQRSTALVADADVPLAPADYHLLYVDFAQRIAFRDRGDVAAARDMNEEIAQQVNEMLEDLLPQNEPSFVRDTGASCDG